MIRSPIQKKRKASPFHHKRKTAKSQQKKDQNTLLSWWHATNELLQTVHPSVGKALSNSSLDRYRALQHACWVIEEKKHKSAEQLERSYREMSSLDGKITDHCLYQDGKPPWAGAVRQLVMHWRKCLVAAWCQRFTVKQWIRGKFESIYIVLFFDSFCTDKFCTCSNLHLLILRVPQEFCGTASLYNVFSKGMAKEANYSGQK
jgi:hypothetical protein